MIRVWTRLAGGRRVRGVQIRDIFQQQSQRYLLWTSYTGYKGTQRMKEDF